MPQIVVKMPDGNTITFPEGTPPETMKAASQKYWTSRPDPAATDPGATPKDGYTAGGAVKNYYESANANALGAANAALGAGKFIATTNPVAALVDTGKRMYNGEGLMDAGQHAMDDQWSNIKGAAGAVGSGIAGAMKSIGGDIEHPINNLYNRPAGMAMDVATGAELPLAGFAKATGAVGRTATSVGRGATRWGLGISDAEDLTIPSARNAVDTAYSNNILPTSGKFGLKKAQGQLAGVQDVMKELTASNPMVDLSATPKLNATIGEAKIARATDPAGYPQALGVRDNFQSELGAFGPGAGQQVQAAIGATGSAPGMTLGGGGTSGGPAMVPYDVSNIMQGRLGELMSPKLKEGQTIEVEPGIFKAQKSLYGDIADAQNAAVPGLGAAKTEASGLHSVKDALLEGPLNKNPTIGTFPTSNSMIATIARPFVNPALGLTGQGFKQAGRLLGGISNVADAMRPSSWMQGRGSSTPTTTPPEGATGVETPQASPQAPPAGQSGFTSQAPPIPQPSPYVNPQGFSAPARPTPQPNPMQLRSGTGMQPIGGVNMQPGSFSMPPEPAAAPAVAPTPTPPGINDIVQKALASNGGKVDMNLIKALQAAGLPNDTILNITNRLRFQQ